LSTIHSGYWSTVEATAPPATIDDLYERFRRPAFALARRILADDVLAEDVVQDVMVSVWRGGSGFDPTRRSLTTWVMTMVHHKAVDAVRREQSQHDRWVAPVDTAGADVEDAACERVDAVRIRTALAVLPDSQRRVLTLAYFDGFTQGEIAALTGTPLGTVKARMHAGMCTLRSTLADLGRDPAPGLAATA
jgi:RNA polymerase sigma-70 factor (ECF subfamily)